jgi:Putative zinc-finger
MSECLNTELRDLLPDLAAERLSGAERARVAGHVAGCETCAAEVELLLAARRVMSQGVPAVDVARIVAALPKPPVAPDAKPVLVASPSRARRAGTRRVVGLAERHGTRRRWIGDVLSGGQRWTAWRIAAAATLAVGGLTVAVVRHFGPVQATQVSELPPSVVAPAPTPVPSSTSPVSPAPRSAAPSAPSGSSAQPAVAQATPDSAGPGLAVASDISDLSDGEVESLLQDMNGFDAQPSADPDDAAPGLPAVIAP